MGCTTSDTAQREREKDDCSSILQPHSSPPGFSTEENSSDFVTIGILADIQYYVLNKSKVDLLNAQGYFSMSHVSMSETFHKAYRITV
jgi:hypothetical protein